MEIRIVEWTENHKSIHIEIEIGILAITWSQDKNAHTWLRTAIRLNSDEAKIMSEALVLAAKISEYIDHMTPREALDAINEIVADTAAACGTIGADPELQWFFAHCTSL